jgi:hypothetical protein
VSFLTALHLHGLIEQIPQIVYAATTGPTRLKKTSLGTFSFHRIDPAFFKGYDWYGERRDFLIATPEKALVDSLYVSSRKARHFAFFPEIDFGSGFQLGRAMEWIDEIRDPMIQKYCRERLLELAGRSPGLPLPVMTDGERSEAT